MLEDDEIWIKLPKGYEFEGKTYAKLNKSLYGLKQSNGGWFQLADAAIMAADPRMQRSTIEPCLYFIKTVYISTHVDDFIICCNDTEWYNNFLIKLKQSFTLKDLGDLDQVLQIDIKKRQPDLIEMSQKRQIENAAIQYVRASD